MLLIRLIVLALQNGIQSMLCICNIISSSCAIRNAVRAYLHKVPELNSCNYHTHRLVESHSVIFVIFSRYPLHMFDFDWCAGGIKLFLLRIVCRYLQVLHGQNNKLVSVKEEKKMKKKSERNKIKM